jgi:lysyl-tRNA synthetase class 2
MKTWETIKNNPELRQKYLVREKVADTIRSFFKGRGFHEVETPILVPKPSTESNLEVFETRLRTATGLDRRAFLIMSPEYSIKKLLAGGMENIFEITRCFRNNEEVSRLHNPEFSMLEWYRTGADYRKIMEDFENLFVQMVKITRGNDGKSLKYLGEKYDLTLPWPRVSVTEVFKKYCGVDTETLLDAERFKRKAREKGYQVKEGDTWEQVFYQLFFNEIEPVFKETRKPVFVYDYPLAQAALARRKVSDPRFAERFEVFLAGIELGNCFSELTDAAEQRKRLEEEIGERMRLGKTEYPIDEEFLRALEAGFPDTAGIAVGIDRLVMLAADVPSISDTLLFPGKEIFDLS